MPVHLPGPWNVLFGYHSAYGVHSALFCTRDWSPTPLVPLALGGSYLNWGDVPCDGEAMITELATRLAKFNPATTVIDSATIIYTPGGGLPSVPQTLVPLGIVGTSAVGGWHKATQAQWLLRDTAYNLVKMVQLDYDSNGNWDSVKDISPSADALALVGALTSPSWAWASRAGFRPATFQKITYKLNDKLRDEYGMN